MIIACAGQKGGVGKTTTAISIAVEAQERGLRVLLVDGDPQGTVRVWHGVAQESGHTAPMVMLFGETMHKELPPIARDFDLVLVDCPPAIAEVQRSALLVADTVILPCGPTAQDAWSLLRTVKLIEEARKRRPRLDTRILINRVKAGTALGRGARDVMLKFGEDVMATEIHDRVAYPEAIAEGRGVTTYAPHSEAADEVRALVDELVPAKTKGKKRNGR